MIIVRGEVFYDNILVKSCELPEVNPDIIIYPTVLSDSIITCKIPIDIDTYNTIPLFVKEIYTKPHDWLSKNYNNCAINNIHIGKGLLIFTYECTVKFKNRETGRIVSSKVNPGCVIIIRDRFWDHWTMECPTDGIVYLYNTLKLENIYRSLDKRLEVSKSIKKSMKSKASITKGEIKGKGDYGYVVGGVIDNLECAVKYSKIDENAYKKKFDINNACWVEWYILNNIIKPIIQKKICPNLPLLHGTTTKKNAVLHLRKQTKKSPCTVLVMELAQGNLKDFFAKDPSDDELYSALFQIVVGLYAIQFHGQITHYDVKAANILYYNIKPGGCWCYIIGKKKYWVPNYGKIFVLSDFGISRSMSPKFKHLKNNSEKNFRVGRRFAMVHNSTFIPIETDKQITRSSKTLDPNTIIWKDTVSGGSEFVMNSSENKIYDIGTQLSDSHKRILKKNNIPLDPTLPEFFERPDILPPFEFYNDLQDVIRTFVGGKRTTQKGNHSCKIKKTSFYKKLKQYVTREDSVDDNDFSCEIHQVLSDFFIDSFFSSYKKKRKKVIETYKLR